MPEQKRKIVFFLGAGASFGAGAYATVQGGRRRQIPTQATFWDTFLRFCRSHRNRNDIESFLFRYFLGYARVPARTTQGQRRAMLAKVDVEEVFTFLSERARAPSTSASLRSYVNRIWSALIDETAGVFGRFGPNAGTRQIYRQFMRNLTRSRDTVVSFNYDTVFEESLQQACRWHYEGIQAATNSIGVLKPHGSINWEDVDPIVVADHPARAVIVAPTHLKFVNTGPPPAGNTFGYLDHSAGVKAVWNVMEREMREAKALVFIGYSFPVADLYFSSVLRSVLAERDGAPGVVIVNPDAVAIRERLRGRFALERTGLYFDLSNFVQSSRTQMLNQLG